MNRFACETDCETVKMDVSRLFSFLGILATNRAINEKAIPGRRICSSWQANSLFTIRPKLLKKSKTNLSSPMASGLLLHSEIP
jgi:hypothetical protein